VTEAGLKDFENKKTLLEANENSFIHIKIKIDFH